MLGQGHSVVGVELRKLEVNDLFANLGATPGTTFDGLMLRHSVPSVDIFVSDVFDLKRDQVGDYDSAALVALP